MRRAGAGHGGGAGELPDEFRIRDEFRGHVGLLLWESVRDTTLWATTDPARRSGLFPPDAARNRLRQVETAGVNPALEVSLTTLVAMVSSPGDASGEIVTLVCLEASRWAAEQGALGTALAYAGAAALASPKDAGPAYTAGSLALRAGWDARAKTWLLRCAIRARAARDWAAYAQACVDLGTLYARHKQASGSRRCFTRAMRASRRHGLLSVWGAALHGLFLLDVEAGRLDEAEIYANAAMRAYGRGYPQRADLLHDIARLWIAREKFDRAIPMLQKLLVNRTGPAARALTLALLARAAAGTGEQRLYDEAWDGAWPLIPPPGVAREDFTQTRRELALAAARMGDWIRMEQAIRLQRGL